MSNSSEELSEKNFNSDRPVNILGCTAPSQKESSPPICQADGCGENLSRAEPYYRRNRVCVSHMKCWEVSVSHQDCRFCQQCHKFHSITAFEKEKRSCRWSLKKRADLVAARSAQARSEGMKQYMTAQQLSNTDFSPPECINEFKSSKRKRNSTSPDIFIGDYSVALPLDSALLPNLVPEQQQQQVLLLSSGDTAPMTYKRVSDVNSIPITLLSNGAHSCQAGYTQQSVMNKELLLNSIQTQHQQQVCHTPATLQLSPEEVQQLILAHAKETASALGNDTDLRVLAPSSYTIMNKAGSLPNHILMQAPTHLGQQQQGNSTKRQRTISQELQLQQLLMMEPNQDVSKLIQQKHDAQRLQDQQPRCVGKELALLDQKVGVGNRESDLAAPCFHMNVLGRSSEVAAPLMSDQQQQQQMLKQGTILAGQHVGSAAAAAAAAAVNRNQPPVVLLSSLMPGSGTGAAAAAAASHYDTLVQTPRSSGDERSGLSSEEQLREILPAHYQEVSQQMGGGAPPSLGVSCYVKDTQPSCKTQVMGSAQQIGYQAPRHLDVLPPQQQQLRTSMQIRGVNGQQYTVLQVLEPDQVHQLFGGDCGGQHQAVNLLSSNQGYINAVLQQEQLMQGMPHQRLSLNVQGNTSYQVYQ
ncbi:hypothetical protein CEUSTIGMA_g3365.t1 [Chlamydomonas eustigma]|uniref:SBP-type domain-containing protein n=1 Tax=Chlamydomonas eustigma TaxID=1157962 RepID=A0A250WZ79_9CHLO|nr:hypothetical protein CEUSTIGMA_g3365.t1 [Chlamydomonas eustigma]|eukprot:GAX75922.1 hypothetical protein CEUSTIGMA_g3365.t1 [Chlamydomonas eustigma]